MGKFQLTTTSTKECGISMWNGLTMAEECELADERDGEKRVGLVGSGDDSVGGLARTRGFRLESVALCEGDFFEANRLTRERLDKGSGSSFEIDSGSVVAKDPFSMVVLKKTREMSWYSRKQWPV
jgi:hypothetical protein